MDIGLRLQGVRKRKGLSQIEELATRIAAKSPLVLARTRSCP